jgi:hypothetical protein
VYAVPVLFIVSRGVGMGGLEKLVTERHPGWVMERRFEIEVV